MRRHINVLVRKFKLIVFLPLEGFTSSEENTPLILTYFIISVFRDRNIFNPQSSFT